MPRYQIVTPHLESECLQALDEMAAHDPSLMSSLAYGCHFGDHTGYAIVEAASEAEVRSRLPRSVGRRARVVEVDHVTPEEIRASHDKAE